MIARIFSTSWYWQIGPLLGILIPGCLYAWGILRLWMRAGVGHGLSLRQAGAFTAGMLVLALALLSPIDTLADELFSVHMLQHMLLVLGTAPLLAASGFWIAVLSTLPRRWASRIARTAGRNSLFLHLWGALTHPAVAWVLFAGVLWAWHTPGLYQAALASAEVHALEHLCLLGTAWLFWWVLFQPAHDRAARLGIALLYLFTAGLQMSFLGALFTLAGHPLYPAYAAEQARLGIDALQDQQLAGLIMWVPGGVLFTLLSAGMFITWFNALEERANQMDLNSGMLTPEAPNQRLSKEDPS